MLIECMMENQEVRESVRDLFIVKGLRINQVQRGDEMIPINN
jgi:hypothetical protein